MHGPEKTSSSKITEKENKIPLFIIHYIIFSVVSFFFSPNYSCGAPNFDQIIFQEQMIILLYRDWKGSGVMIRFVFPPKDEFILSLQSKNKNKITRKQITLPVKYQ